VKPRLDRLKNEYPDANTTYNFFKLTKEKNIKEIIDWQDDEKPQRIIGVTIFFVEESIETEADLKAWLEEEGNVHRLKQLRGIGNKTADYFKLLAGIQTAAIDVHLMNFLKKADIYPGSYREAQEIIHETADLMGLNRATLDHSIWIYMSQRRNTRECGRAKRNNGFEAFAKTRKHIPKTEKEGDMETLKEFVGRLCESVGCFAHITGSGPFSLKMHNMNESGRMGVFGWVSERKRINAFRIDSYKNLAELAGVTELADEEKEGMHYISRKDDPEGKGAGISLYVRNGSEGNDYQKAVRLLTEIMKVKK